MGVVSKQKLRQAMTPIVLFLFFLFSPSSSGLRFEVSQTIPDFLKIFVPEDDLCTLEIVESIPQGLVYNNSKPHLSTFQAWEKLLKITHSNLDLASSYWSLRGIDIYEHPSDWQGEKIFEQLQKVATENEIKIRIAQNDQINNDTKFLSKLDNIEVKALNFSNLMGD